MVMARKKKIKKKFKKLSILKTRKYFLAVFLILILVTFFLIIQKLETSTFSCIKTGNDLKCEWKKCLGEDRVIVLNHENNDNRIKIINTESGSVIFSNLNGKYEPLLICGEDITTTNSFLF
ncbi:MAG: hypothetical protein J7J93_02460 [Candidatus Aenigmarchaeota archaeon]|nr:hypothetical protein [Candidatus Aenigmarchaeota archaeon]